MTTGFSMPIRLVLCLTSTHKKRLKLAMISYQVTTVNFKLAVTWFWYQKNSKARQNLVSRSIVVRFKPLDYYWHCTHMLSRVYVTVGCPSFHPSVCPINRSQKRGAAGLLLSAVCRTGDIDWQRRAPSSNGAAARRSAANVGSTMLTAENRTVSHGNDVKIISIHEPSVSPVIEVLTRQTRQFRISPP